MDVVIGSCSVPLALWMLMLGKTNLPQMFCIVDMDGKRLVRESNEICIRNRSLLLDKP